MGGVYGGIVTEADIRGGFEAGLKLWLPAYLGEVAVLHGRPRDALPSVASWHTAPEFDVWPEDHLPAVVTIAPGLVDIPHRGADGLILSRWAVGVGVVVTSRTRTETLTLAGLYAAAVRAAVLQHPGDMGTNGVTWADEGFTELDRDAARTLAAGMILFEADIPATVDVYAGPIVPPPDPHAEPPDSPSVTSVAVETENLA